MKLKFYISIAKEYLHKEVDWEFPILPSAGDYVKPEAKVDIFFYVTHDANPNRKECSVWLDTDNPEPTIDTLVKLGWQKTG